MKLINKTRRNKTMRTTNKEIYLQALIDLENQLAEGLITFSEYEAGIESLKEIYKIGK